MCRSIKSLFNFATPASEDEIDAASLQYVRKLSGFHHPSKENEKAFHLATAEVAKASRRLLESFAHLGAPRDRAHVESRRPCTLAVETLRDLNGFAAATLHEEKIEGSHSGRSRKAVLMKKYRFLWSSPCFSAGFLSASEVSLLVRAADAFGEARSRSSAEPVLPARSEKSRKSGMTRPSFSETDLFSDIITAFTRRITAMASRAVRCANTNGWLVYDAASDETGKPLFREGEVKDYYADGTLSEIGHYKTTSKTAKRRIFTMTEKQSWTSGITWMAGRSASIPK